MKKGILTFHNANNLGAVLQAYALQVVLSSLYKDDETEIIDYDNGFFKEKSKKKYIKGVLENGYYAIKNMGFNSFRKKYLKLSSRYDNHNIIHCNDVFDTLICGSDQIWNLSCSNNDYNYFLSFANEKTKKISYAASIGNYSFSNNEKKKIYGYLKDFDKISIREEDGLKEFKDFKLSIDVMPDPVFLLSKEEWLNITPKSIINKKYVFVYLIQDDINVMNSAIKYSRENDCIVISNKSSLSFIFNNSPEKFLSWIYYADAVFTNSFHGTAISLIFNKKLGADVELKNGKLNNRVYDVLKKTYSTDCIINSDKYNPSIIENYNYIDDLRRKGITYLQSI